MTLPLPVPTVARVPSGFMSLADAAARMGKSVGHVRRLCAEQWEGRGWAHKEDGEWIISKQADPSLADFATEEGRDLRQLSELVREGYRATDVQQARGFCELAKRFADFPGSGGRAEDDAGLFLNRCQGDGSLTRWGIRKPKPETFLKRYRKYKRHGDAGGPRAVIRKKYSERGRTAFGEQAQERFVEIMRVGHGIHVADALDLLAGEVKQKQLADDPAWAIPSPRTAQIFWDKRIPRAAKILISEGPHKMRAKAIPKIERDASIDYAAGELLVGDERTSDFYARDMGERGWYRFRPKGTFWRDAVSGKIVGWHIGKLANSDTILATFKQACLAMNTIPREFYVDNGLDYRAVGGPARRNRKWDHFDTKRVETAAEQLGVVVHYAMSRAPWAKNIEPTFNGDVGKGSDRLEIAFIGGSPSERPFDAERWSKANILELPTLDEVRERFAARLRAYDEEPRRSKASKGLSPQQSFERHFTTRPRRIDKDTLDILCRKVVGPVRVGRDGVRYERMRYGTFDEAVFRIQGREVWMLVDPIGRDSVILDRRDGSPLIVANIDRPLGYKSEEIRDRIAFQRRCEKSVKEYASSRDYLLQTPAQQIAERRRLAAIARQIPDSQLPPKPQLVSVEMVRPDVAVAAVELHRAAGAEALRRLSGVDAAAEAVNRPRPITFADLAGANAGNEEETESPERRMTLTDFLKTEAATHVTE